MNNAGLYLKITGIIVIAIGLIDLVGSYAGFDLWGEFIGVQLPEFLWKFSSYIEMGLGYGIMTLGSKSTEAEAVAE